MHLFFVPTYPFEGHEELEPWTDHQYLTGLTQINRLIHSHLQAITFSPNLYVSGWQTPEKSHSAGLCSNPAPTCYEVTVSPWSNTAVPFCQWNSLEPCSSNSSAPAKALLGNPHSVGSNKISAAYQGCCVNPAKFKNFPAFALFAPSFSPVFLFFSCNPLMALGQLWDLAFFHTLFSSICAISTHAFAGNCVINVYVCFVFTLKHTHTNSLKNWCGDSCTVSLSFHHTNEWKQQLV